MKLIFRCLLLIAKTHALSPSALQGADYDCDDACCGSDDNDDDDDDDVDDDDDDHDHDDSKGGDGDCIETKSATTRAHSCASGTLHFRCSSR